MLEDRPAAESTLLFPHIPKSAGTSIRELVTSALRPGAIEWIYRGELRLAAPDAVAIRRLKARLPEVAVVLGHFSYGVHELLDTRPRYATVIRHPLARLASWYRHLSHRADSPLAARVHKHGWSLADLIENEVTAESNNHMCRILSGTPDRSGARLDDPRILDRALENVERDFEYVGFVEDLEESFEPWARAMGWGDGPLGRLNVGVGAPLNLDRRSLAVVEAANRLDLALYERLLRRRGRQAWW